MILRRSEDGAVKCALRDFRLEEDTFGLNFIAVVRSRSFVAGFSFASCWCRRASDFCVLCGEYDDILFLRVFYQSHTGRVTSYLGF